MEIKIVYEVSTKERGEVFDTLDEARQFAMSLLKSDVKDCEGLFIRQKIYVNGVFEEDVRIDYFFKYPIYGIDWCFKREIDDVLSYYDFFLKEENNVDQNL